MIRPSGVNALDRLEEYDTGLLCTCGDCTAHLMSWIVISGRRGKETRRVANEFYCPQCGCSWDKRGMLTPCLQHDDPRTGIRLRPETAGAAGWVRLDAVAVERWDKWFPGISPWERKAHLVLEEIDLFVRLRGLFPTATFDELLEIRKGMRPFVCSRCGAPVDWRIKTDYAQARAAREAYHHSLGEDL